MLWCGPAWSRSGSQENAENFVHMGNKCRASFELCFLTPRSEPFPSKSCSSQSSRFGAGPHPDPAVCLTSHVLRSWLQSCLGLCPSPPRDPQSICSSSMSGCSETFFPSVGKKSLYPDFELGHIGSFQFPFLSHSAVCPWLPQPPLLHAPHPLCTLSLLVSLVLLTFCPCPPHSHTVALYCLGEQVQLSAPQPLRPSSILALPEAQAHISGSTSYTMSVCQGQ